MAIVTRTLQGRRKMSEDLISKQTAIHAIMGQPPEPHYPSWYAAQIEALPPVIPKVVKCGDCRWNDGTAYCEFHYRAVKGDDFCSWGEKK